MRRGTFKTFQDLTNTFGANNIDHVGKYYIFDIAGNNLCLIAAIHFNTQKVYIRYILNHCRPYGGIYLLPSMKASNSLKIMVLA